MALSSCKLMHPQFRNSSKKSVSLPTVSAKIPRSVLIGLNWVIGPSLNQSHDTHGPGTSADLSRR